MSRFIKIGVALAIAVVALATPAHADDQSDQKFREELEKKGLLLTFLLRNTRDNGHAMT